LKKFSIFWETTFLGVIDHAEHDSEVRKFKFAHFLAFFGILQFRVTI